MVRLMDFRVGAHATDDFEDHDVTELVKAFREAGIPVTILALDPAAIEGARQELNKGKAD
jgi:hypothetical protein